MCNFTGILCIVNHGTSRSIFLIANFVVLFQKYSCEEKYFSRCHVLCYPPNWYKERSINENPRSILLFALTEYFAKGKYFSWFHGPCYPLPPHTPTYTKNDRLMKIQEVFSYSLWLYLFIFIFIILRKESTFRDFIRFDSHKTIQMKTMTSVNPDTTLNTLTAIYQFHNTRSDVQWKHSSVYQSTIHITQQDIILYNSIIDFNNSRGNNNIPILTIIKDLSEQ
jgi:hypothetical protein